MATTFCITTFDSTDDVVPKSSEVSLDDLAAMLSVHEIRAEREPYRVWSPTRYLPGAKRIRPVAPKIEAASCFVLDFDKEEGQPGFKVETIAGLAAKWKPFTHIWHTTWSSGDDLLRLRVIFPLLNELPASEWRRVWKKLAIALGFGLADRGCKDVGRVFMLPSAPLGGAKPASFVHHASLLDEGLFADIVEPKIHSAPWTGGERVPAEKIVEKAREKLADGRHYATLWVAGQLYANGYTQSETLAILAGQWTPTLPLTDTKGKHDPYTDDQVEKDVAWIYTQPPLDPWKQGKPTVWEEKVPDPLPPPEPKGEGPWFSPELIEVVQTDIDAPGLGAFVASLADKELSDDPDAPKPVEVYTAFALQKMELEPLNWIVENFLVEGLSMLIGHSKTGKSFIALALAAACARGGKALGAAEVTEKCRVLYVAAEDGKRRIRSRLSKLFLHEDEDWPENLLITNDWPMLDNIGCKALDTYLAENPGIRLVILDTLNALRPSHAKGSDIVMDDYRLMRRLKAIGDKHHAAVLVVHHAAQHQKGDGVNQGAGTHGLPAACDTIMSFTRTRGEHDGELQIMGRDVEETTLAVTRDEATGFWSVTGKAAEVMKSKEREEVYEALKNCGAVDAKTGMTPSQMAKQTGRKPSTIHRLMAEMVKENLLVNEHGRYYLAKPKLAL